MSVDLERMIEWIEDQAQMDPAQLRLNLVTDVAHKAHAQLLELSADQSIEHDILTLLSRRLQTAVQSVSRRGEMSIRHILHEASTRSSSTRISPASSTLLRMQDHYISLNESDFKEVDLPRTGSFDVVKVEDCEHIEKRLADLYAVQRLINQSVQRAAPPLEQIEGNVAEALLHGQQAKDLLIGLRDSQNSARRGQIGFLLSMLAVLLLLYALFKTF